MTGRPDRVIRVGLNDALSELLGSGRVLITTHVNPDGDALGSERALASLLRTRGVHVDIRNSSPVPHNLRFLDRGAEMLVWEPDRDNAILDAADLVVAVDLNAASRLRDMRSAVERRARRILVVDHHLDPEPFADAYWIDENAAATAELIARLADASAVPLAGDLALGIYTGIMTDTGSFRFERTTPDLMRLAARLLEAGIDPSQVYADVYDRHPMRRSRLIGLMLSDLRAVCDGRAVILLATRDMYARSGAGEEDVEDMVNLGLAIEGVKAVALLSETTRGIRASFRSRDGVAVEPLARTLGGGGHRVAAGATLDGSDAAAHIPMITELLCAAIAASDHEG